MAAVNLSSLATFWAAIKKYISSHFLRKPILLATAPDETSSSITLNVNPLDYSKLIIVMKDNDKMYIEGSFSNFTSSNGVYYVTGGSVSSSTTNVVGYVKIFKLVFDGINGLTISAINELALKSSSATNTTKTGSYISSVWGVL